MIVQCNNKMWNQKDDNDIEPVNKSAYSQITTYLTQHKDAGVFLNNSVFVTSDAGMQDIVENVNDHPIWNTFAQICDFDYTLDIRSRWSSAFGPEKFSGCIDSFPFLDLVFKGILKKVTKVQESHGVVVDFTGRLFGQSFSMKGVPPTVMIGQLNKVLDRLSQCPCDLGNHTMQDSKLNLFQIEHQDQIQQTVKEICVYLQYNHNSSIYVPLVLLSVLLVVFAYMYK